jgi:RNA polymerase subunit RPABC4/transcription elongation factor Spt4
VEIVLFVWLIFGIWAFVVADQRGENGCIFGLLGVALGPIGLIFAYASGLLCHRCGRRVSKRAQICPYCHTPFNTQGSTVAVSGRKRFCEKCGSGLAQESAFCQNCGESAGGPKL